MAEVEEEDTLGFVTRLSLKELANGNPMSGSRTFAGVEGKRQAQVRVFKETR